MLDPRNGGRVVAAADEMWAATIDGAEGETDLMRGDGIFGFQGGKVAVIDTFSVLLPYSHDYNLCEFELLVSLDSPTGRFQSIGTFATQNLRFFEDPYQHFSFPPVPARYLKVRPLSNHSGYKGGHILAYEFKLFGVLAEE